MAQKPTPIREQTRAVVRSLLARTAFELFAAKGYDDTTVEEVAAAAGVSRRTLFNYFRNKEDLALSGLSEQGELIAARFAERPADEDPWASLRAAFHVVAEIETTAERRLEMTTLLFGNESLRAGHAEKQARWQDLLAPLIEPRLTDSDHRTLAGTRDRSRGDHLPSGSNRRVDAPGRTVRPVRPVRRGRAGDPPSRLTTREEDDMTDRLPAADLPNMVAALRAERAEMLNFTSSLTDDEWTAPSAAAGWRIADVVAHIGATARNSYTPAGLRTSFAASLEQLNEDPVDRRRDWSRADVMAEYQRASRRATTLLDVVRRTPATRVRVQLAELGRYPMAVIASGVGRFGVDGVVGDRRASSSSRSGRLRRLIVDKVSPGGGEQAF